MARNYGPQLIKRRHHSKWLSNQKGEYVPIDQRGSEPPPAMVSVIMAPVYNLGAYAVICLGWPITLQGRLDYYEGLLGVKHAQGWNHGVCGDRGNTGDAGITDGS